MKGLAGWTWVGALFGLMLAGAPGCGSGGEASSPESRLPAHVRVSIIDATAGVGKADGDQWDGLGQVPVDLVGSVAGALVGKSPYVAIGRILAPFALGAFEKPDPTGWAEVLSHGDPVGRVALRASQEDTFNPQWQGVDGRAPSFGRVPLSEGTRIRVQLVDDDEPLDDDQMGIFEINYQDLVAALEAQQVHHVNVAEQTNRQILFVGIAVMPE